MLNSVKMGSGSSVVTENHSLSGEKKDQKMDDCVLKFDHFENIHRLKETLVTPDAPNFRKVKGFPVFGTGQPTVSAFKEVVVYVKDTLGYQTILWTNMRQECVVYANGSSFTPREANRLNENMEMPGVTGTDLERLQEEFVSVLKKRAEPGQNDEGKARYFKDTYAEHPEDRKNIEHVVPLESDSALKTLSVSQTTFLYYHNNIIFYNINYVCTECVR